jgi:hypothetical protein
VATAALSVSAVSIAPIAHADSSTPTTYYVYNSDSACSDSGPGTQAEPFCSLQAGVDAANTPGDTVIATGIGYAPVTIGSAGTAAAPITIEGTAGAGSFSVEAPPSSTSAPITLSGASYVTVKDFAAMADSARDVYVSKSKHVTIDSFSAGTENSNLPGLEIAGESSYVTVSRGQFADDYRTAPSIQVDPFSSAVVITTNGIQNPKTAIAVAGSPGTDVTSNTAIDGCGTELSLTGGSSSSSVVNNVFDGFDGCGMAAFSAGVLDVDATSTLATTVGYNVINPDYGGSDNTQASQYPYEWGGGFFQTTAAFAAATAQGDRDIVANPEISGPGGDGFEPSSSTSPALNSANSDAPGELPTDVDGNPRMNDPLAPDTGTGTYDYYDRGAGQAQPSTYNAVTAAPVGALSVTVASQDWSKTGYTIDFGDGSAPVQAPYGTTTHTYAKPGKYEISVSGTSWTSGTPFTDTTSFTTQALPAGILWQGWWPSGVWSGWNPPNQSPSASSGIAQAAITARSNELSVVAAVTTTGAVELDTRNANDTWRGWTTLNQPGVKATSVSIAGMPNGSLQLIEVTSTDTVRHIVRNPDGTWQASGWGTPAGSTGITQAAITAMPDGSSQLVAVTTGGVLEHNIRYANGSWQGWNKLIQPAVTVKDASIAGMPNGSSQIVEVTTAGILKHNIRNANGSWQAQGWASPAGSTGIAQADITATPYGSSELVAVTTGGVVEHNIRYADGSWQASGWDTPAQTDSVAAAGNASIAGLSDGETAVIEVSAN